MTASQSSLNAALYGAVICGFPYGLLVVGDAESEEEHDDWDPAALPVHAGRDSLYISVRPAESGVVDVVCLEGPQGPGDLQLMFSGEIRLSKPNLSLSEPGGTMNLELPVERRHNLIQVFGDDPVIASKIEIILMGPDDSGRV